jgi:hypothetical protein
MYFHQISVFNPINCPKFEMKLIQSEMISLIVKIDTETDESLRVKLQMTQLEEILKTQLK